MCSHTIFHDFAADASCEDIWAAAHWCGGSGILLISKSLWPWTQQSQQKAHLSTDLMNKPAQKWANTEGKMHKGTQNHAHSHASWCTLSLHEHIHHEYRCNCNCSCYSNPLWRKVVRVEWSCEKNTDAQGKWCWQRADSVVAPLCSHHTRTLDTNKKHVALGQERQNISLLLLWETCRSNLVTHRTAEEFLI